MQTFYIKGNLQYFRFIKNILIFLLYNFSNQVAKCDDGDETGGIGRALNKFYDSKPALENAKIKALSFKFAKCEAKCTLFDK